jgi:hypothetical protein
MAMLAKFSIIMIACMVSLKQGAPLAGLKFVHDV